MTDYGQNPIDSYRRRPEYNDDKQITPIYEHLLTYSTELNHDLGDSSEVLVISDEQFNEKESPSFRLEPLKLTFGQIMIMRRKMANLRRTQIIEEQPREALEKCKSILSKNGFYIISIESHSSGEQFNGAIVGSAKSDSNDNRAGVWVEITGPSDSSQALLAVVAASDDYMFLPVIVKWITDILAPPADLTIEELSERGFDVSKLMPLE
ncbi:MAG: hypothetical protein ACW968_01965 [Candidatus Thorarchaeota archaeon]